VIFTSDNGGDVGQIEETQAREKGFKNNGDFRGDKHTIWEGGFKVPFVVRWPNVIKEGSESKAMINIVDIFSTLQEIVGGKVLGPRTAAADSFSFCSELLGKAPEESRETMVLNDVTGVVAIRMDDWKYIEGKAERPVDKARQEKFPKQAKPQLYNLKQDPAEAKDIIDEFPEIAEKMQKVLDRIRSQGSERAVAQEGRK
jgi:arylsulfatase A-like enzyme